MIKTEYYDGLVVPDGMTLEELEAYIKAEDERSKNMTEWDPMD